MAKKFEIQGKILENRYISGKTWLLRVEVPEEVIKNTKPASFAMIKPTPDNYFDPLLRRAFAIADIEDNSILLFYDVHGKGTSFLTSRKEKEEISILAPLGNNFFPEDYDNYIIVGGGIGFAGLSLLMKELRKKGKNFISLYGARTKEELSMMEWINKNGFDVRYYTDDGSFGKKGFVTQDLKEIAEGMENVAFAVCGPTPMMKAVSKIAKDLNIPCYLSLESRMACGIGICIGCVIKDKENDTYIRVCYEGPVFEANKIELL